MRIILILISYFFLTGCYNPHRHNLISSDFIIKEKDLVPEGLALDKRTGTIYIGSTYKRKIIQIDTAGNITDFIPSESDGIWSPVGMDVDEHSGILWVNTAHAREVMLLMHPDSTKDWMTGIFAYSIGQKKLLKKYILVKPKAFLNDVTVSTRGDVFATESVHNDIYIIPAGKDNLELFIRPSGFHFLNGITIVDSLSVLYVASTEGILKIDLLTKEIQLLKTAKNINAGNIDGLLYHQNYLIGHQSSKVSKFYLNHDQTEIIQVEILDAGKEFDSSTTGDMGFGEYCFIVNSQISSGVDYQNKTIKPMDSLENIIIRKIKLN